MLVNSDAIAQQLLLQLKDTEPVHVSMSRQSIIALDCSPIFQPMSTNHALYRFVYEFHRFFLWTNWNSAVNKKKTFTKKIHDIVMIQVRHSCIYLHFYLFHLRSMNSCGSLFWMNSLGIVNVHHFENPGTSIMVPMPLIPHRFYYTFPVDRVHIFHGKTYGIRIAQLLAVHNWIDDNSNMLP